MNKYMYEGPVMEFDRCIQNNWKGETVAASETKARSNLSYQWKKKNNRIAGVRITLPGKLPEDNLKGELYLWKNTSQTPINPRKNSRQRLLRRK